jgi:hypothetical protein
MTTEHDARTRIVASWLREDAHENAERVLLAALNEIDHTQQRRSWWPARRFSYVSTYAKVLVAAAAVVAVAVVGINLLPGIGSGTGGSQPSPSPTAAPTASPEPTLARVPGSGPIEAGTYRMTDGQSSIRVTIPQGWVSIEGTDIRKHRDQPNEVTFELYSADIYVYPDACATEDSGPRTGPTADDLLAALRAQQNSDVSEPTEITIGGHPGVRLEVSVPEGLDVASCTPDVLRIWHDADDDYLHAGPTPVYIVETSSGRIVFRKGNEPEATAADLAELQGILDSIQIEPAP